MADTLEPVNAAGDAPRRTTAGRSGNPENQPLMGDGQDNNGTQGHIGALQMSCKDPNMPAEIRTGFVKKVYGMVFWMLGITFGICVPFVFHTDATMKYMDANPAIMATAGGIFITFYVFNMCAMMSAMCGSTGCIQAYFWMFRTFPVNVVFLTTMAGSFGFIVGAICAQYTVTSVCFIFLVSAALIVALTVYAIKTESDMTGYGMYILVAVLGLMFTGMIMAFFPGTGGYLDRMYGGLGAIIFGFIIVYDTQLIFGCHEWSPHPRKFEYTIDMYAFAAFNLYLDFINFILFMLRTFGNRR